MANPKPTQNPTPKTTDSNSSSPSPLRCLIGSVIAGIMSFGLYLLTSSIAHSFASKSIQSDNITVVNITVAVRTLVVGVSTLATGIFGLIAVGLVALAIQTVIQQLKNQPETPPS